MHPDHDSYPRGLAHYLILIAAVLGAVAIYAAGFLLEPDARGYGTHEQLGLRACGLRDLLGGPCPTCGVTTSVALFLHGSPLASLRAQPFGFALVIAAPLLALWAGRTHVKRGDLVVALVGPRGTPVIAVVAVAVIVAWTWTFLIQQRPT